MTLGGYLKIFRQRWLIIAVCVLLGAGVVFAFTPSQASDEPPVSSYTATATLVASDGQAMLGRVALLITTGEVPRVAAETLGFEEDPAILAKQVTVTPDQVAQAITVEATDPDAQVAADRANAFADAAVATLAADPASKVTLLQAATPIPNYPTGGAVIPPSRPLRTALGAAIGLLLGLGLAIVRDHLDGRLRSRKQIGTATGLPVVAEIPKLKPKDRVNGSLVVKDAPLSPFADGYRSARSAIVHGQRTDGGAAPGPGEDSDAGLVILVTSAVAGEGKTTSASNLAASFAETGRSVLVIDADLRKPDIHERFLVPQAAGASDFLLNQSLDFASLMRPTNVDGVKIITAGTQLEHPASLTSRMAPLVERARTAADIIILDASPLLAASDAFDILPLVDTVLFVARSGRLTTGSAEAAAEVLNRFRVPVAGMVIIGAPGDRASGYGYGYGNGYGYGYGAEGKSARASASPDEAASPASPGEATSPASPDVADIADKPRRSQLL